MRLENKVWKVCGCCPFTFSVASLGYYLSYLFFFFLQKGSLNQNNSFVRKVKATVCWHPDTRVRSGCIKTEESTKEGATASPCVWVSQCVFSFYCHLSDWGEQPRAFNSAVMIIIIFNTRYRWRHQSPSKCHTHCLLRTLCFYFVRGRWGGGCGRAGKEVGGKLRWASEEAEGKCWGLSSFKCQK